MLLHVQCINGQSHDKYKPCVNDIALGAENCEVLFMFRRFWSTSTCILRLNTEFVRAL